MNPFKKIAHFSGCRSPVGQQARVESVRVAAEGFRADMLAGPALAYFESFDLVKLPYATRYGLRNAFSLEWFVPFFAYPESAFYRSVYVWWLAQNPVGLAVRS